MSEVVNVWGGECLGGERLTIDKKLCKAMNFHYSTLAVYCFYHYQAVYYYYYFSTLAVYYAARNCGSFRSS